MVTGGAVTFPDTVPLNKLASHVVMLNFTIFSSSLWARPTLISHTAIKHYHTSSRVDSHFQVDLIHEGDDESVEVSQEKRKDATQLPLQGHTRVVVFQGADDVKQHGAEHSQ